jgi:transposase-like protein
MSVNWVGVEELGEKRILEALAFALRGESIPEIARKTGIPAPSLYSIREHGPFAHRSETTEEE